MGGQAARVIVQHRRVVPQAAQLLRAIYDEDEFQDQVVVWGVTLRDGLKNLNEDPGPRKTVVQRLISASPGCVFMQIQFNYSASTLRADTTSVASMQLVPLDRSRDERGVNPTAWMIRAEGNTRDGSDPGNLCPT